MVRRTHQRVVFLQFGKTFRREFLRPVIRRRHALRLRRKERGKFDIPGADAEQARIFASAAALHRRRRHHRRTRHREARIERREHLRLGAAAARAGAAEALRIHVGQRGQEIQRAHRIPSLQAHDALRVRFGLRTEETPKLARIHLGPLPGKFVRDLIAELLAVAVAQHVIDKGDDPHARELHADRLEHAPIALRELFAAALEFLFHLRIGAQGKARIVPVAVRTEHRRERAGLSFWPIDIPRHEEPGHRLEIDFLDGVILLLDAPVDHSVERRTRRFRPQPERHAHLHAHLLRAD